MRRRILISNNADDKYLRQYLTLRATESGKFSFSTNGSSPTTYYSLDSGYTWNEFHSALSNVQYTPTIPIGGTVMWKASGLTSSMSYGSGSFISTGKFTVEGNLQSMLWGDDFIDNQSVLRGNQYVMSYLFSGCTKLTSAENLQLPATVLRKGGYYYMFYNCSNLKYAPKLLPADCIDTECYMRMFYNCTSLISAPEIEAEYLSDDGTGATSPSSGSCYGMFEGCTSLITPPSKLKFTKFGYRVCAYMFKNCTSLAKSPEFTVTEIQSESCIQMFNQCSGLTKADIHLNATKLDLYCYKEMFCNCRTLTSVTEIAIAEQINDGAYTGMFKGCTSLTHPQISSIGTSATTYFSNKPSMQEMYYGCSALTEAPELPMISALQAGYGNYVNMFNGCTSLTTAPELPCSTINNAMYNNMFNGCSSLNYVKCLATSFASDNCTTDWLLGVSSTGTFVKPSSMTRWSRGASGIPSGWTIVNI